MPGRQPGGGMLGLKPGGIMPGGRICERTQNVSLLIEWVWIFPDP